MSIVDDLVPHMRRVQAADRDLHDLSLLWQMIEAASAISCPEEVEAILPTLTQTRVRFADLQERLVRQLGQETLAELGDELASTAQCTIDILVRNLFERTADVGFLATDDVLRAFCAAAPATRDAERAAFVHRLAEYRAKYTVYDDIVLLAPDGQVLARLDDSSMLASSADPIVAQAATHAGYVERFAPTDLAGSSAPALLYGHRVNDAGGRCIGVLVLRFRSSDELQRIFASVGDKQRQIALLLIDQDQRVIVSNDESHVPLNARMQAATDGEVTVSMFGGREYLSVTCATRGYQGYSGPGWRAQAMVSLLTAFRNRHDGDSAEQAQVSLDNDELHRIQTEVDAINRNLRRVVWNGHVVAGAREGEQSRLKAVLEQVNGAGTRTRDRVAIAIRDLYRTSLGRAHHQAKELSRLAADIMDRNLYERANDCRWWALSPVLQRVLAAPADAAGTQELNAVLSHINSLYTVYTRLVAFDAEGIVRGLSNEDAEHPLLGSTVDAELLAGASALADSQRYAVSAFAASGLSGGEPTYIYLAAVRQGGRVVGGIAIVFNAAREFRAILDDVLAGRAGLAAFVDADGRVIASTDPVQRIGEALGFDAARSIAEYDGAHFAVARLAADGYREFKRSDGYRNDVSAVVALRLGSAERRQAALHDLPLKALPTSARTATRQFALFQAGSGRFALPSSAVLEACSAQGLVRTPGGRPHALGLLDVPGARSSRVIPVFCGRSLLGVDAETPARDGDGVVLVIAAPWDPARPLLGLRVDDVISVADVGPEHLQDAPAGLRSHAPLLVGLLRMGLASPSGGEVLVQLIDGGGIAGLAGPAPSATAAAGSAARIAA